MTELHMSDPKQISLALSGGGFRATLFHLGVVRFLYERGLLPKVRVICSVSGGSILAAHLSLNWSAFNGDGEAFDKAAASIIDFTRLNVRGRILRRWLLGTLLVVPRVFGKLTFANLLEKHYFNFYNGADLSKLGERDDQPDLHILSTSLTTGHLCKFTKQGFVVMEREAEKPVANGSLFVSTAVAASSAFPPLFPPIAISRELLNADEKDFDKTQFLSDGGVFDNLGLHELARISQAVPGHLLIVSDAGGNFDWTIGNKYSFIVSRNVRATNILMDRVSKLVPAAVFGKDLKPCIVDIGRELEKSIESTALPPEQQRGARNVRTDLDSFSYSEIDTLIRHGYSEARAALREAGVSPGEAKYDWMPLKEKSPKWRRGVLEIEDAKRRRLRLFEFRDGVSWFTLLVLACWIALFIFIPTVIAHYKSKEQREALLRSEQRASLLTKTNELLEQETKQRILFLQVLDAWSHEPISAATVTLALASNGIQEERTSDKEGTVQFVWRQRGVELNGTISVSRDGYESFQASVSPDDRPSLIMLQPYIHLIGKLPYNLLYENRWVRR